MKDYYKILGVGEEASEGEIRVCWAELSKRYHPDLWKTKEADAKIEEINEALEVLTDYSKRLEYDFERNLKRSVIKRAHRHKERKFNIRKIIVPAGILILFLIVGIVVLRGSHVAELPKSEVPYGTDKVLVKKTASQIPPGNPESKPSPPSSSVKEELRRNEEPARNILPKAEAPVNVGKEIPEKVRKENPQEETSIASAPSSPPFSPAEEESKRKEEPVPQLVVKSESPVRVDKEVPKETGKVASHESAPSLPQEIVKIDKPKPIVKEPQPAQKPETTVKAARDVSLTPPLLAKEEEVRQFFLNYIDRYNRKDIDGLLSFFSSKAVQNQKDGFMRIKNIYAKFLDESQELRYQVEGVKMEIYQNSVEVKARFRMDQILKKRGEEKGWKGNIRWVLVKEDGTLRINSLDYQNEKSP